MIDLLVKNQLFLLFFVITLGYAIGRINIFGIKLGAAAVLFVGLFIGALNDKITLPAIVTSLGLVIFVYTIGISSGASFFAGFKKYGMRDLVVVLLFVGVSALAISLATSILKINGAIGSGIFSGSLTNTPSLAASIQLLSTTTYAHTGIASTTPTIGYSIAYPLGVIGPILAIFFWQKRYKINYKKDIDKAKDLVAIGSDIHNRAIVVTNKEVVGKTIEQLVEGYDWSVVFVRVKRGGKEVIVSKPNIRLELNDIVSVIGTPDDIYQVAKKIGAYSKAILQFESSDYMYRRVFVSEKSIIGSTIGELRLPQKFSAITTRVRRGDADMIADNSFVLEYGDRVRYVTPLDNEKIIAKLFGDSYRSISDIHPMSIGLGICIGLLVGMIPIPLPGGLTLKLGDAGGPLIVGLVLSYLRRSGPFVWSISYSANHTLRDLGLSLMLAGIGIRSGQTFINGIKDGGGLQILVIGGIISVLVPLVFIPIAYKFFKLPFGVVAGMVSAIHTQPAVTSYASQQAKNDLPSYGYVRLFPITTITKIIIAQLMILFLV